MEWLYNFLFGPGLPLSVRQNLRQAPGERLIGIRDCLRARGCQFNPHLWHILFVLFLGDHEGGLLDPKAGHLRQRAGLP